MERVSVIVPVYNIEEYICECLDSIVKQSYDNLEIIVIDDGSTDDSLKLCVKYQKKYSDKVLVFHNENGGLSAARNYGIKKATGEYITFVDGDDTMEVDAIKEMVKCLKKYNADVATILRSDHPLVNDKAFSFNRKRTLMYLLNHSCFEIWGKLYKRNLFENIEFPIGKTHEDLYIIPDIILKTKRNVVLKKGLYNYRIRNGSIMEKERNSDLSKLVECCIDNIESIEKKTKDIKFKLRYQKWYYYHILWYFYDVFCNLEKKESRCARKNMARFYRKTFIKYWTNPYIKVKDKCRFTWIALVPGLVRDYNIRKYGKES